MKLLLLSIDRESWESHQTRIAFEQARDAARRIDKKVDLRHERVRFTRACESIESLAREKSRAFMETSPKQAREIAYQFPKQGSITLNFASPSELKKLAEKIKFLRELPQENGLVAIPLPSSDEPATTEQNNTQAANTTGSPDFSESEADLNAVSTNGILHRFHNDLREALRSGECLGMGGYRHETFVKGVRDYINVKDQPYTENKVQIPKEVPDKDAIEKREATLGYRLKKWFLPALLPKDVPMKSILVWGTKKVPTPVDPIYLRIAFQDGSEGEPFPLFCLPKRDQSKDLYAIHAALISSRHFELDAEIDICILRNAELSRSEDETFADQERIAFRRAKKTFESFIRRSFGAEIHLYHTGLEPAVIGTYRALMEILRWPENRGRLVVIPKLYRGNTYDDLDAWF